MAIPRSARKRVSHRPPKKRNQKPAVLPAGEMPAKERYSVYRTMKIMQLLLQGCREFIFCQSPHFTEITAIEARKLHGEIARHEPTINAVIARCEGNGTLDRQVYGSEGGDA